MRLLGGPSAGEPCGLSVMAGGAAVELWIGVLIAWVGAMLSLWLERVLLLTGSSEDCVCVAFVVICVLGQLPCER